MKTWFLSASALCFLAAVTVVIACPNPRIVKIQSPSDNDVVDPNVGTSLWAIVPGTYDPWLRGYDTQSAPIYCRYKFKLVNVTDNVTTECSNYTLPALRRVVFDEIDQWSWGRPVINWGYGKTYRLELWQDADPSDSNSTPSGPVDCVTFYTSQ